MPEQDFNQFRLSPGTLDAIAAKGYETPSPIQAKAIPPMLEGHDLTAEAQTGTGKTAGFGIPIVEKHMDDDVHGAVALVLTPTRELALQVHEEIKELARGSRLGVAAVYGGAGFGPQIRALSMRRPFVLVATPGRLLDLMQRGDCRLDTVRTLVLDEADRMLDMGFIRDVERILRAVPEDRQTALFSATLSGDVRKLAKRYMRDPVSVAVEAEHKTADLVEQFHIKVDKADKHDMLFQLLHTEQPEQAIVFTRTKHLARRMADKLQKGGWMAVSLQGNMTQNQRERALGAFRDGKAKILVATDVAARGLDVPTVSHVINFDIPPSKDTESYVHRIGRTARMGRTGRAFTFVQSDERRELTAIERTTRVRMTEFRLDLPHGAPQPGPNMGDTVVLAGMGGDATRRNQGGGGGGGRPQHRKSGGNGGPRRSQHGRGGRHGGGSGGRGPSQGTGAKRPGQGRGRRPGGARPQQQRSD